ncbi:hypothetical protein EFA69_05090 [Rufibacter immobilis]|uniref:Uncharacterized protein n=1 Tax=Rufibacter immobilis TaxID=1348778 RepID=A0A3M9N4F6_9BACT|nr:hypothetical protein EFA69_05090 [Rufibacter immobilis]
MKRHLLSKRQHEQYSKAAPSSLKNPFPVFPWSASLLAKEKQKQRAENTGMAERAVREGKTGPRGRERIAETMEQHSL